MSHTNIKEEGNVTVSHKLRVDSLNLIERIKKQKQKKSGKTKALRKASDA